jgi:DNA-directed RNA polymerase subunit M/transcription elongation factor TFIIS
MPATQGLCPKCRQALSGSEMAAGKKLRCPRCGATFSGEMLVGKTSQPKPATVSKDSSVSGTLGGPEPPPLAVPADARQANSRANSVDPKVKIGRY